MLGRFTVRPADDGSNRFGVWDGAVNGWRATDIDDETEAHRIAAVSTSSTTLTVRDRPTPYGTVDPAQPVQRAQWQDGELDVWIRDNGEWLGRVRDKDGRVTWIPGTDLRPF